MQSDSEKLSQVLVIAHRNADVQALNTLIRAERVKGGNLDAGYAVKTHQGDINLASGDRILCLKNDRELGVSNGRFATVESIDFSASKKVLSFTVILDGSDQRVTINPLSYPDFIHGYAATVHKTQGMTVDHSLVYVGGKGWNRQLTYVALSRHRFSCAVYADRETHENADILNRRLSRLGLKDSVLDFPLAFAERRGIDSPSMRQKIATHWVEWLTHWKTQLQAKLAALRSRDQGLEAKEMHTHETLTPAQGWLQERAKTVEKTENLKKTDKTDKKAQTHKPASTSSTYQRIDMKRLRSTLNARAEAVALHYLGQPKSKQGPTLRYGSNQGSLVVTVAGEKQGLWRDFQLDQGGDMFNLIQHALNTRDFKTVLTEATRFLGGDSLYRLDASETVKAPASPANQGDLDAHRQQKKQKIEKAQAIYRATLPIAGTLAEWYLREHRGILGVLDDKSLRYHPQLKNWMTGTHHPALVILARNEKNDVRGLQAIFLNPHTAKKATELGHHVKLSRGLIGEGAMIVHGG